MSTKGYIRLRVKTGELDNFVKDMKYNEDLMFDINTKLAFRCNPYVPFKEGRLSSVNITRTGVSYNAPYAHYQYAGIVYGPNYPIHAKGNPKVIVGWFSPEEKYPTGKDLTYDQSVHPNAGPEWDKRMLEAEGDAFMADCQEVVNRYIKKRRRSRKR